MVRLEWVPFETGDPGLELIENRVMAKALTRTCVPTLGSKRGHAVGIACTSAFTKRQTKLTSRWRLCSSHKARHAHVGTRTLTPVLFSDPFAFPRSTSPCLLPSPCQWTCKYHGMSSSWFQRGLGAQCLSRSRGQIMWRNISHCITASFRASWMAVAARCLGSTFVREVMCG